MNIVKNILLYTCISSIFVLHPGLNKGNNFITELQYFIFGNSMELLINSEINTNKLSIVWQSVEENSEVIIYRLGEEINKIPSATGEQKLVVYYNNRIIGKINHYKSTKNQAHKYLLSINSKSDAVFFKGEVIGPSAFKSPATTTLPLASL